MFRDNLSTVKQSKAWNAWPITWTPWPFKMGQTGCPETSVINHQPNQRDFWGDITRRRMVVSYRRFGTTCRSILEGPKNPSRGPSLRLLNR